MKSILLSALLVVLVFASPFLNAQAIAQAAASDEADVEALVEAHTANGRIQSERPTFEPEPDEGTPRRNNHIIEAIGKFFAWIFQNFGWLIRYLLIGAVVAVVAYALWYMLGGLTLPGRRKREQKAEADFSIIDEGRPAREEAEALLQQADALAAEGRYAEAVHLLLFRSIADLNARRAGGVPQSLTAREIERLGDLPERARAALSPIIRLVEKSFFGDRPVDQSGWKEARASYEAFAFKGARA